jgi:hypothetical protein
MLLYPRLPRSGDFAKFYRLGGSTEHKGVSRTHGLVVRVPGINIMYVAHAALVADFRGSGKRGVNEDYRPFRRAARFLVGVGRGGGRNIFASSACKAGSGASSSAGVISAANDLTACRVMIPASINRGSK